MSDSIKNKITRAAQQSGYKTVAYTAGTSVATHEVSYINIPWGAIVTDVVVVPTAAFTHSSGTTHVIAGTGVATVTSQDLGTTQTPDPNGFLAGAAGTGLLATAGKRISAAGPSDESLGGELLGSKPPYSLSDTYGSNSEEKVVPVTLSWVNTTDVVSAGSLIWWVEYMFPANIVWLQTSL